MFISGIIAMIGSLPQIGADEIVARMLQMNAARKAELQSYISVRCYTAGNKLFNKHGEMTVRMKYVRPGAKSYEVISQKGSGMIRKRVLQKVIDAEIEASKEADGERSRIIPDNYTFELLGSEAVEDRSCY